MTNQTSFSDMAYDQKRRDAQRNAFGSWTVLPGTFASGRSWRTIEAGQRSSSDRASVIAEDLLLHQWYALSEPAWRTAARVESIARFAEWI